LPIRYSQTDRSKLFIEIAAIHSSETFFMFHHVSETLSAALILKDAQSAGLRRKDSKIHRNAFVPSAALQNNMPVHYAAASRLRRAGENRPVSLRVRRKGKKKEKDRSQSHEVDAVYRIASSVPS
jgi:hypothetical protein